MRLTGGCLCGAVRYEVDPTDGIADYCHCSTCRRAGGAAAVAWLQVAPSQFAVTAGEAVAFASSAGASRHFCGRCGSQLFMRDAQGRSVGVTLGTLDDPEAVPPTAHGWDSARPRWLVLADDLPRHPGDPPYDRDS